MQKNGARWKYRKILSKRNKRTNLSAGSAGYNVIMDPDRDLSITDTRIPAGENYEGNAFPSEENSQTAITITFKVEQFPDH